MYLSMHAQVQGIYVSKHTCRYFNMNMMNMLLHSKCFPYFIFDFVCVRVSGGGGGGFPKSTKTIAQNLRKLYSVSKVISFSQMP